MSPRHTRSTSVTELVEHFHLDASTYNDHTLLSFPLRNRRNEKKVERWTRKVALGQGSFGLVWLEEKDGDTKNVRAVKQIRKPRGHPSSFSSDYACELYAMARLSRNLDHFPEFYGWYESLDSVYLSMEYFQQMDLASCIRGPLAEVEVKAITQQLLTGLKIMHECGITHRDLKLQNIFVAESSPNWWVKIGDFGISKRIGEDNTYLHTVVGTESFMAPEILDEDNLNGYTNAVDMWALGCVLYSLLTWNRPFKDKQSIRRYARGELQLPVKGLDDQCVTPAATEIVRSLLASNPEDRPSALIALQLLWTCNDLAGMGAAVIDHGQTGLIAPTPDSMPELMSDLTIGADEQPMLRIASPESDDTPTFGQFVTAKQDQSFIAVASDLTCCIKGSHGSHQGGG